MKFRFRGFFSYYLFITIASFIPVILFGIVTYKNEVQSNERETIVNLKNINNGKKEDVERFLKRVAFELQELRNNISFFQQQAQKHIVAMEKLQKEDIIAYYVTLQKTALALVRNPLTYTLLHNPHAKEDFYILKQSLTQSNVFLINRRGNIVYVSDEKRFKNRPVTTISPAFATFWQEFMTHKQAIQDVYIVDFSKEEGGKEEQFMVVPLLYNKGFLALEVDQKPIENILHLSSSLEKGINTRLIQEANLSCNLGTQLCSGPLGTMELVSSIPLHYKNMHKIVQTRVNYIDTISPQIDKRDYLQQFVQDYRFHDVMLLSPQGKIMYSLKHKKTLQTDVDQTPATPLAHIFSQALQTKKFVLSDIGKAYGRNQHFSQFAAIPVMDEKGRVVMVIVVQLHIKTLTQILRSGHNNYYKTLDTYIVGDHYELKTDIMENTRLVQKDIRTFFANTTHTVFHSKDYAGRESIAVYSLIDKENFRWALVTQIDQSELDAMTSVIKKEMLVFILIFSIIAVLIMILISSYKKKQDEKLLYSATHDSLTRLPNRRFVFNFLEYILANTKRKKSRGAVFFMDLDNFKFINDSYGHEVGDFVLVEVSQRLKSLVRENDILARLGGDEFLVIVNSFTHLQELDVIAQRIVKRVCEPIKDKKNDKEYQVGVSIGISVFPDDSYDAKELLQFADTAMYKTKAKGRNSYTYYSKEMTQHSINSARVESELKRAIENDELLVHYQPQIDIRTNTIVGVEALVRWMHPQDGLIMPNNFIPIAEESQLIFEIGKWVTRKACTDFKSWKEAGYNLEYVAVNMSSKQLGCKECSQYIKSLLKDLDFNPEWLELEITENTLIENFDRVMENIEMFKKMGISFSIDDFGTGYSSLSYLKSLKISTLKIDREFIKDILVDKDDFSIVKAVITMGHSLNYTIIAEGAESKEVVNLLRELGCDMVQGYYYSKPLGEMQLLDFMDTYEKRGG